MLVATAGHVDHGKTSLVQRLTGVDTDRLDEEQRRGLSIELGFAFREAGPNVTIGFIDVPGHHRFINTMIAGIGGIDLGMLVVAADDGPMPQTLEHLQLLRLLGVERFTGVISKIDLVDASRVNQVVKQTQTLIPDGIVCKTSNRTGEGISQLLDVLHAQAQNRQERQTEQQFRMYIDRVFTKKGAGLVVTGTSRSGTVTTGDELRLHTVGADSIREINVRIREIHAQGKAVTTARSGQRCALNLAGKVSKDRVNRGDFLCANPGAFSSRRLDTRFCPLQDAQHSVKHLGRVKLYIGTRRISARTCFLDRGDNVGALDKRSSQRVQLILDKDVLAFAGDRFVIRDDSESETLGGGIILDPEAPQWGKSRASRLKHLDALEQGDPKLVLEQLLFANGDSVSLDRCKRIWNLSDAELEAILEMPPFNAKQTVRLAAGGEPFVISCALWVQYRNDLEQALGRWHAARPMEPGIKVDALKTLLLRQIPGHLFKSVLDDRIRAGQVIMHENRIHAIGHRPTVSSRVQQDWQRLAAYMTQRGFNLPLRSEIQKDTGLDPKRLEELVRPALKGGELYPIGEKRLALPATLHELACLAKPSLIDEANGLSVIQAKQVFGLGRNLTIEILEFFDQIGYTKRVGGCRIVARPEAAEAELGSSDKRTRQQRKSDIPGGIPGLQNQ